MVELFDLEMQVADRPISAAIAKMRDMLLDDKESAEKKLFAPILIITLTSLLIGAPSIALAFIYYDQPGHLIWSNELLIAFISTIVNIFIIFFHATHAPHPKFVMVLSRRVSMATHIIAGVVEISSAVSAIILILFLDTRIPLLGQIQACSAFFHIASAVYQTPIVFGAKGIMQPAYYLTEMLHLFFAVNLLLNPTSYELIMKTYLALCIFTWTRVYILCCMVLNILHDNEYTVSILMAGVTLFPFLMGPSSIALFLIGITLGFLIVRKLSKVDRFDSIYLALLHEHQYGVAELTEFAKARQHAGVFLDRKDDLKVATTVFSLWDTQNLGYIEVNQLTYLRSRFRISAEILRRIVLCLIAGDGQMKCDAFIYHVWPHMRNTTSTASMSPCDACVSDEQKAKYVFERLDFDGTGILEPSDLQKLLTAWGCPKSEVDCYMKMNRGADPTKIRLEEFTTFYRPIWRFIFRMFEESEQRENMMADKLLENNRHSLSVARERRVSLKQM